MMNPLLTLCQLAAFLLPFAAAVFLLSPFYSRVSPRLKGGIIIALCGAGMAAALAALILLPADAPHHSDNSPDTEAAAHIECIQNTTGNGTAYGTGNGVKR